MTDSTTTSRATAVATPSIESIDTSETNPPRRFALSCADAIQSSKNRIVETRALGYS